jgi:hypothetical protein
VDIKVGVGDRFAVSSRFAQRDVSAPGTHSQILSTICMRSTNNPHGGNRELVEFRAVTVGHAQVHSSTADCGPCAQLGFVARVTVTP